MSGLDATRAASCVFCRKIAAGGDEHSRVEATRAPAVVRFAPLNPVVDGHMLFVPTRHVNDAAVDVEVAGWVFEEAARWAAWVRLPFNLITSAGEAATQTVPHLHVHYVPRADGDGLHLPWTGQT